MFVVCLSAVKDMFEDLKRHNSDNFENNRPVMRLDKTQKKFVPSKWKHLQVGEIIMVEQDQFFPSDLILLRSSNAGGLAYVETKNLDGETNLKHKTALKDLQKDIHTEADCSGLSGKVVCEPPNDMLYKYEGTLEVGKQVYALDANILLVRGSSLKNTEWVYGLVVYTGHDTKIMMNSSSAKAKFSNLEKSTNTQIVWIFLF